jgi:outer membrane protein, heavy metal efflux system
MAVLALSAANALAVPPESTSASTHADVRLLSTPAASVSSDPLLAQLISQSLAARPGIAGAKAAVQAERERIPQAGAMPDPMLQVGIQNDGFTSIEVGRMPTSYYSIMASQTFPWPGKRGLQQQVVEFGAKQGDFGVQRARLTTEADVRRAYLSLVLVRDRLEILDRLEKIWERSAGIARIRYEAGQGIQSDVLRSRLELERLKQKRLALRVEERIRVQQLNRLRAHRLDEAIVTTVHVRDLPTVASGDESTVVREALARSPELAAARLRVTQSEKSIALAQKSYYPDLTVSAGLMYRGTMMPPMWLVTVGAPVPIFSGSKQSRNIAENEARRVANQQNGDEIEQVLRLRVQERQAALASLSDTAKVYQSGLLQQSEATIDSTLSQYAVGKVSLASVLEANASYLNDVDGYLQTLADAQRVQIDAGEISLQSTPLSSNPGMNTGGMGSAATSASSSNATETSPSQM